MKVLIATPLYPPDVGGPATFTKIIEEEMPKRGIGVRVVKFSYVRRLPAFFKHIEYFRRVFSAAGDCDVIIALDPLGIGLPALCAALLNRKRFFVRVAGDRAWEAFQQRRGANGVFIGVDEFQEGRFGLSIEARRRIQVFVAKRAFRVIVPSEFLKTIVERWGVGAERIAVVYNSFEPYVEPKETKSDEQKKLGLHGKIIVSAGRLVLWKGFDTLIKIMPLLAEKIPDAKLYIIGDGRQKEKYKSQILAQGLGGRVFLLGSLTQKELYSYISAADLFVLNSGYEGLSHQLLEVMALGTPIVATDVGGNPELIENGKSGVLVRYGCAEELVEAIERLLKNVATGEKMAKEAKQKVKKFNKEKMLDNLIKILCAS